MLSRPLRTAFSFLLPLAFLSAGCDSDPCVLDGRTCHDELRVIIQNPDDSWDQGEWLLEVTVEGTTTLFSFVFNNSVQGFYNLDGPVFAKLAKQRQCVTSGPNTTCDDIPGKFELLVWTRGKPKDASLRLHKDGQLVANRDIVPTYVPTAPSEECAPMCEQSITEWILP